MEQKMALDISKLLNSYSTKPLSVEGQQYGSKFVSETGKALVVTNDGGQLYEQMPSIILDIFSGTPEHMARCKPIGSGMSGDVYSVDINGAIFAEKRYKDREDGITQIQDMAKVSLWTKGFPRTRVPKTYFASVEKLFMEYVNAPTWEQMVKRNPLLDEKLSDSFYETGYEELLNKGMEMNPGSIFVETDPKTGDYRFIIIDPVIGKH